MLDSEPKVHLMCLLELDPMDDTQDIKLVGVCHAVKGLMRQSARSV